MHKETYRTQLSIIKILLYKEFLQGRNLHTAKLEKIFFVCVEDLIIFIRRGTWLFPGVVDFPGLIEGDKEKHVLPMVNERRQVENDCMPIAGADEPLALYLRMPFQYKEGPE